MKNFVVICWITLFLLSISTSYSQRNRIFYSIDEAQSVSPDSVFKLHLTKQKLREIPTSIYVFKNLIELNLSQNKLRNLPDDFYFPNLEILNIEKNDLGVFSESICKHANLKSLYLGKNNIAELPECIGDLKNLIILDLWFNPIRDLPVSLTQLRNLRSLDLRGVTFSKEFQKKWNALLPWVKIEFDLGCDCGN